MEGERDIDIIKAPIVIDNVSQNYTFLYNIYSIKGFWTNESWHWWRVRASVSLQFIVSPFLNDYANKREIEGSN